MTLLLPDCKVEAIKAHCLGLLARQDVSVRELSQLIGKMTASIQAIFPAILHYRSLQHLKHQALAQQRGFDATIALSSEAREELHWWSAHLDAWNGRALLRPAPDLVIETDASRKGWGAVCQGVRTGGLWSQMERTTAHQLLGTVSRFIRSKEFCEGSIMCPCEASHGQHFGCSLCEPPRGNTISSSVQFGSGPMGVGSQSEHFSKCRTPCRTHECYGRLAVSSLHRFEQLAVMPRVFQALMQIRGPCAKDLFADRLNTQLPRFYIWKPDPMALAVDAFSRIGRRKRTMPFPVLPDHESTGEVAGIRRGTDTSHAVVAHTGLVSHPPGHVSVVTGSSAHEQQSPIRASRENTPTDLEHDSPVSRVACIKRSLQSEGICANASKLILAAWRPGTNAIYNSAWTKWHSWCLERKVDSFRPTLADITGFLAHSFDEGLEYRTLNTYRSALSGVLPPIDGFPVGQHPLVVRLLMGVFLISVLLCHAINNPGTLRLC